MRKVLSFCLCFLLIWQCIAQETNIPTEPLLIPYLKGDLYGFSDQEGNMIIQPNYESAKFFNKCNLALVQKDGLYGYINLKGQVVIPCFSQKALSLNKTTNLYNQNGIKDSLKHLRIVDDRQTGKWVLFNKNTLKTSSIYQDLKKIKTKSVFQVNHGHYYSSFYNGIRKVLKEDRLVNFINMEGQELLANDYPDAKHLSGNYYCIGNEHQQCALLDRKHGRITDFSYQNIEPILGTDYFIVTQQAPATGMGMINAQGKPVSILDYEEMKSAFNGYIITLKQGKYGLLNTKGDVIIPFEYDTLIYPNQHVIIARKNNKEGILDYEGKVILAFDDATIKPKTNRGFPSLYELKTNTHNGFVDSMGHVLFLKEGAWSFRIISDQFCIGYKKNKGRQILRLNSQPLLDRFFKHYISYFKETNSFLIRTDDSYIGIDQNGVVQLEESKDKVKLFKRQKQQYIKISRGLREDYFTMDFQPVKLGKNGLGLNRYQFRPYERFYYKGKSGDTLLYQAVNQPTCFVLPRYKNPQFKESDMGYYFETRHEGKKIILNCEGKSVMPKGFSISSKDEHINRRSKSAHRILVENNEGALGLINIQGQFIIPPKDANSKFFFVSKKNIRVWTDSLYYLYDIDGKLLYPEGLDYIALREHHNRLAIGKIIDGEKYYGFVDSMGQEVIPIQYESIGSFRDSVAAVGRTLRVIRDSIAQTKIPIGFDQNGDPIFKKQKKVRSKRVIELIDINGNPFFNLKKFGDTNGFYFKKQKVIIKRGDKFGLVDFNLQTIIPTEYHELRPVYDGRFYLGSIKKEPTKKNKWNRHKRVFNASGEMILDDFNLNTSGKLDRLGSDYIYLKSKTKQAIFDSTGKLICLFEGKSAYKLHAKHPAKDFLVQCRDLQERKFYVNKINGKVYRDKN